MLLHVFSDLHVRTHRGPIPVRPVADADVIVCAGDVGEGLGSSLRWLRTRFPDHPIVFVAGNHEHYREYYPEGVDVGRRAAADLDIAFLENDVAIVAGIEFVGTSLWTDYRASGSHRQVETMLAAQRGLLDHSLIRSSANVTGRFTPEEALAAHGQARTFLERSLAEPPSLPRVVITHHCPDLGGIHPRFAGDPLNAAFVSDLGDLVAGSKASCWIHGHVHHSRSDEIAGIPVVCNPGGYPGENFNFDPELLVHV